MIIAITVTFLTVGNFPHQQFVFIFLLVGGAIGALLLLKFQ